MRTVARAHPLLAAFSAAYLAFFLVLGLVVDSDVVVPYVVLILLLAVLICRLELRYDLGTVALWGMALWGAGHLAGGVIPLDGDRTLYNAIVGVELFHFDRLVHAFGFGIATLVCGKVMLRFVAADPTVPSLALWVLIVLAGLGVGAVNEIVEFIATLVLPDTNVGGYVNTGWDLIFDLAGGIVAAACLRASRTRSEAVAVRPAA